MFDNNCNTNLSNYSTRARQFAQVQFPNDLHSLPGIQNNPYGSFNDANLSSTGFCLDLTPNSHNLVTMKCVVAIGEN